MFQILTSFLWIESIGYFPGKSVQNWPEWCSVKSALKFWLEFKFSGIRNALWNICQNHRFFYEYFLWNLFVDDVQKA
jgi:hypothetical protein